MTSERNKNFSNNGSKYHRENGDLRKAGVQLSPQLLYRDDRVLILGMRALEAVVHAPAQAMA